MKVIEITVKLGGKIQVEASGYQGAGCVSATEFLETLGKQEEEREYKEEFYLPLEKEELKIKNGR